MQYWMIVERLENWQVDQENEFQFFGVPSRKMKLSEEICAGDKLITYVSSGISAFADIRNVESEKLIKLKFGGDYDTAFPKAIPTRPEIILSREKWVPMKEMVSDLELTKNAKDWRQILRNSLRKLSDNDGKLLYDRMSSIRE